MSSILILPVNSAEPDLNIYRPIRQTRRFKYYTIINNPNQMEVDQIANANQDELDLLVDALANAKIGGSKRRTRRKSRKSRKSRKYRK